MLGNFKRNKKLQEAKDSRMSHQRTNFALMTQCSEAASKLRDMLRPYNKFMPLFIHEYKELEHDISKQGDIVKFMEGKLVSEEILKMANVIIEKQKHI